MAEGDQPEQATQIKYRTFANRGSINEFYFLRYEDCIDSMAAAIQTKVGNTGTTSEELIFKSKLVALYWSTILPREKQIGGKYPELSAIPLKKSEVIGNISKLNFNKCLDFLALIGSWLYDFEIIKTDYPQLDKSKILIAKMEETEKMIPYGKI